MSPLKKSRTAELTPREVLQTFGTKIAADELEDAIVIYKVKRTRSLMKRVLNFLYGPIKPWQQGSDTYPKYDPTAAIQLKWENWSQICDHVGIGRFEDGKPEGCYIDEKSRAWNTCRIGIKFPMNGFTFIAQEGDWLVRDPDSGKIRIDRPTNHEVVHQREDGSTYTQSYPGFNIVARDL